MFRFSLLYLFLHFGAFLAEAALRYIPAYADFATPFRFLTVF